MMEGMPGKTTSTAPAATPPIPPPSQHPMATLTTTMPPPPVIPQRPTMIDLADEGTNTTVAHESRTVFETPRAQPPTPTNSGQKKRPSPVAMKGPDKSPKAPKLDWEAALAQLGGNEMIKDPNDAVSANRPHCDGSPNTDCHVAFCLCDSSRVRSGPRGSTPSLRCYGSPSSEDPRQ